jgi:hypothetical protein
VKAQQKSLGIGVTQDRAVRELLWGEGAPVLTGLAGGLGNDAERDVSERLRFGRCQGQSRHRAGVAEMTRRTRLGHGLVVPENPGRAIFRREVGGLR